MNNLYLPQGTILKEKYILNEVISSGGFGVTYCAQASDSGEQLAVKEYLPTEFATRRPGVDQVLVNNDARRQKQFHDGLSRFITEGRKIMNYGALEGVAQIVDCFEGNGTGYIVMKYVQGELLADMLSSAGFFAHGDAQAVIEVLSPIFRSLEQLHKDGIAHLDISPENIIISNDGTAKLIDFSSYRHVTTTYTRSIMVLVKEGYSPEEIYRSGGDHGAHTDVYSLAAVLYKMLTDRDPIDALERARALESGKKDPLVSLKKLNGQVSSGVENAILNALNVRIEDRTPDVATFFAELNAPDTKRKKQTIKALDIGKWPSWAKVTSAAAVMLITTMSVLLALGIFGREDIFVMAEGMARVPSLVNTPLDDARGRIESAGLQYMVAERHFSDVIPLGFILAQDLSPGIIVEENTIIILTISGGQDMALMPFVLATEAEAAQEELEEAGFSVRRIYEYSRFIFEGNVTRLSQNIAGLEVHEIEAGQEFPIGGVVRMHISRGPDPESDDDHIATVPNVVGMQLAEAMILTQASNFAVQVLDRRYGQEPEGTIVSQTPPAGSSTMTYNPVNLVISLGVRMALMPDVVFAPAFDAEQRIRNAGFALTVESAFSDSVPSGNIISQSISGIVEHGSAVTIVVSTGGQPFAMPDLATLADRSAEAARIHLVAQGLIVHRNYEFSSTVAEGNVIGQSPSPGQNVVRGDTVTITISTGVQPVAVPNIVGMTQEGATNTLVDANLNINVISQEHNDTIPTGSVIRQTPIAGSNAPINSNVNAVISLGRETANVPDFANRASSEAVSWAVTSGFGWQIENAYSRTVPAGMIVSQSPAPGSLYIGETVNFIVSLGPDDVAIPNVVGDTSSAAESRLQGSDFGFRITTTRAFSDAVEAGHVSAITPGVGNLVPWGSEVAVVISDGPIPRFSITYDSNGGAGNMQASSNIPQGNNYVAPTSTFTRAQHTFEHWNTRPDGTGATFRAGEVITNITANLHLYAIWRVGHIPVTGITDVPSTAVAGTTIQLTGTIAPANATGTQIVWSINDRGTTNAQIHSGNMLWLGNAGTVSVTATVINGGATEGTTFARNFNITVTAQPVFNIIGVPDRAFIGEPLTLTGVVLPAEAIQTINWSVHSAGGTGAAINDGILNATTPGTAVIRATVPNGQRQGVNFVADFHIIIEQRNLPPTGVTGVPTSMIAGTPITLTGTVMPANATVRLFTWSVQDAGTTGASISGNILNATASGTAIITANITDLLNVVHTFAFGVTVTAPHVPVTGITGVPEAKIAGQTIALGGTILPADATGQSISWSTASPGASISGNQLTTTATTVGTVTVTATVANGGAVAGQNFTQNFTIAVAAPHVPVTSITGVPESKVSGQTIPLSGSVLPANATGQVITWSVQSAGTTGALISGNQLTTTAAGTVTVTATVVNGGLTENTNFNQNFTIAVTPPHIPPHTITGVPESKVAGQTITLSGTVMPPSATEQTITWSVASAGTTGANISGNQLSTTAAGTATVTATIANAISAGQNFTQNFTITVTPQHIPVTGITGFTPETKVSGQIVSLSGSVLPANATGQVITWSVQSAGTTGAFISGNQLTTTAAGTVTVTATVANGGAVAGQNFTQNFTITVAAAHVPVESITANIPDNKVAGQTVALGGAIFPAHATGQSISWSVASAGTTGAFISGNQLTTTAMGTVTVTATVANGGAAMGQNFTQNFTITVTSTHLPVTGIVSVPTEKNVGASLNLVGTIVPPNATGQTISWSIASAGTTGAILTGGNTLTTTAPGTVSVTATVANGGAAMGQNFTQNFNIVVTGITGVATQKTAGASLTLGGTLSPAGTTGQIVSWAVTTAGTTGATISDGVLTTTAGGEVTITATFTIGTGASPPSFTQRFVITVNPTTP